jgi:hypothetical protein
MICRLPAFLNCTKTGEMTNPLALITEKSANDRHTPCLVTGVIPSEIVFPAKYPFGHDSVSEFNFWTFWGLTAKAHVSHAERHVWRRQAGHGR